MSEVTAKLFWQDPYRTSLTTRVRAANGHEVSLVQTILYANSGGQESDAGTINGLALQEARKEGLDIWYRLLEPLTAGDPAQIELDWPRRWPRPINEFEDDFRGKMDKSRIDFLMDDPVTPLLSPLAYWEIDGFARVSCGGTHIRHTGEIGQLTLKRKNIGKGKERIEVYADPPSPA